MTQTSSHEHDNDGWTSVGVLDSQLSFTGNWQNMTVSKKTNAIKGTDGDGNVTFAFKGNQVKVIGFLGSDNSSGRYYIDGALHRISRLDVFNSKPQISQTFFMSGKLSGNNHTIIVEHKASDGGYLWLDEFRVANSPNMHNDMASDSTSDNSSKQSLASVVDPQASQSLLPTQTSQDSGSSHGKHGGGDGDKQGAKSSAQPSQVMTPHTKSIGGGAIAGIVVASLILLAGLMTYCVIAYRRSSSRRRMLDHAEDGSRTTVVRIISQVTDEPTMVESRTPPERQRSILRWLQKQHRESVSTDSLTKTSSVIFTSAFAPTVPMSSVEPSSPGPPSPLSPRITHG